MFSRKPSSRTSDYLRALGAASHCGLNFSFQVYQSLPSKKHMAQLSIFFFLPDEHMSLKQVARILGRRFNLPAGPQKLSSLALHLYVFISLHPHLKHLEDNSKSGADRRSVACSRPNCSGHSRSSLSSAYYKWIHSLHIYSKTKKMMALETPSQMWWGCEGKLDVALAKLSNIVSDLSLEGIY